jgi:Spy/CpxP family protein refolding chaperone
MMHKPTRNIVLAVAALALAIPAFLYAGAASGAGEHGGWHGHDMAGHDMAGMAKALNLTQDQKDKVHAVFSAHKAEIGTQVTQLHQAKAALESAIHADTFDESAIRTAAQGVAQAEAEIAVIHGKIASEVRPILTAEQLAKAKELLAARQQKEQQHFTHMQQHPQSNPNN